MNHVDVVLPFQVDPICDPVLIAILAHVWDGVAVQVIERAVSDLCEIGDAVYVAIGLAEVRDHVAVFVRGQAVSDLVFIGQCILVAVYFAFVEDTVRVDIRLAAQDLYGFHRHRAFVGGRVRP